MGRAIRRPLPFFGGEDKLTFHRLIIGSDIYFSKEYGRIEKRNSYSVLYRYQSQLLFGQIRYFVLQEPAVFAVIDRFQTCTSNLAYQLMEASLSSIVDVVEIVNIVGKCFCICTGDKMYVAQLHCSRFID